MAGPLLPCSSAAYGPGDCEGVGCASSRHVWPLHHVRHNGGSCRLCSSCVLTRHRDAFCSVCLLFVFPDATMQDDFYDPVVSCSSCGVEPAAVAHLACIPDPSYFVCPACAAAAEGLAFSKRARDMVDVASRILEAEAMDAKQEQAAAPSPLPVPEPVPTPATPELIKKKTPKSSAANRSTDKPLKINSIQKPALAFAAAAAAAAASSMPLSTPSSGEERKPIKLGRGSANRGTKDDRRALFGAFQL
ncbi:hypothetical protein E2562_035891 [Oryza meyeriana var. granulata]|uniref:Uncharacterized protein n=1 Tax=Oryza meyeriana var. granulata TaxID=110450 RepID=A0A6G1E840_9ORYZ|nr:hypothetical protein E2562_035891 [Oryza meyeriana var. granulata]